MQNQIASQVARSVPDVFLSHASEDKAFTKSLADMLVRLGIPAWWDGYQIELGDDIREKVTEGLRAARYGVIILSENFYGANKRWTKDELAALWTSVERDKLLPVHHGLAVARLAELDPMMAARRGVDSQDNPVEVAAVIARKILGPTETDSEGRRVFRNRTLRLSDLAFDANGRITDTVFSGCTLVGSCLCLNVARPDEAQTLGVRFLDTPPARNFERKFVELPPIPYGRAMVGVIGLRNIIFERCYFKEVGFGVTSSERDELLAQFALTPGTGTWPVHLNPLHAGRGDGFGGYLGDY
ncbi:toll/interleukin-1 receptor domain-containing protein [Nakamurella flava]|uniref:Toll/interleukin-1 receptor domain-containing protein n=1 Tax=Nakamurella flava TaxID=2576308 RepID=A0A4U6QA79_9ACTN|nr:toll/interleukin-1 receptor domain-containing protein [Nakamurella flava]